MTEHAHIQSSCAGAAPTGWSPASAAASAATSTSTRRFYRVGFVVLALLGGAGLLIYGAAALVMPDEGARRVDRRGGAPRTAADRPCAADRPRARRRRRARAPLPRSASGTHGDFAWVLVLARRIVLLLLGPRLWNEVTSPPALRAPSPPGRPAAAGGRIATAPAAAADRSSFPLSLRRARRARRSRPAVLARSSPLAASTSPGRSRWPSPRSPSASRVVGGALPAPARRRARRHRDRARRSRRSSPRRSTCSLERRHRRPRTTRPRPRPACKDDYRLGIGELELDLGKLALPPGETHGRRPASASAHLLVIVPPGVAVRVESHVGWGDSEVLGARRERPRRRHDRRSGRPRRGAPTLVIDAHVGAGQIEVGARRTMSAMALAHRLEQQRRRPGHRRRLRRRSREALGVDPTLVRLVFALLALAGGAGIALYAALWFYMRGQHWIALLPLLVAGSLVLGSARALAARRSLAVALIARRARR